MTKEEFITTIQNQLAAGVETAPLLKKMHEMDVVRMVEIAYETLVFKSLERYIDNKSKDPSVFDSYTITYEDVDVQINTETKESYVEIPLPMMQLPKNLAIRHIGPSENPDIAYWYRPLSANRVYSVLDVEKVSSTTTYNVVGSRIVLKKHNDLVKKVLLRFLPSFSEIDEDEQIYFPMGTSTLVFEAVTDMMMGRMSIPEPVYNNNNSKQR